MTIILGIDPGSHITGFGLIKREGNRVIHIENGTIYLADTAENYTERLVVLHRKLETLIQKYKPTTLAVENIFYHKNPKSVQKLGEVRGVILLSGALHGLKIGEYTPREVKNAITGYGAATKEQVQYMIRKILNLKDVPEENASDALAVAICQAHSNKELTNSVKDTKPQTRLSRSKELLKQASFYR